MIAQLGAVPIQLVFLPLILAALPQSDYGLYALALSISTFATVLTFPSMSHESKVGIARGLKGTFAFALKQRSIYSLPATIGILAFLVFAVMEGSRTLVVYATTLLGTSLATIMYQSAMAYFLGNERFREYAFFALSRLFFANAAGTVAAVLSNDVLVFVCVRFLAEVILNGITVSAILMKGDVFRSYADDQYDARITSFGVKMTPANLLFLMQTQAVNWLLALFMPLSVLAVFNVAYTNQFRRLADAIGVLPQIRYAKKAKEGGEVRPTSLELLAMIALGAIVSCALVVFSYLYVSFLLPIEYQSAFQATAILAIGITPLLVKKYYHLCMSVTLDHKALNWANGLEALVMVAAVALGTYYAGLAGACWAVVITQFVVAAIISIMARPKTQAISLIPD